ncbi:MAG: flippase-like domain-containing protein [Deltaproteobacteria bacterium]|nr:flippase-like domain-containing protein [Deltaproteobacteria bacterium]
MKKLLPRLLVSLVITCGLVWWVNRQGLPILPPAETFGHMQWWAAPAFLGLLCLVHFFRAFRWQFLVRPMSGISLTRMMAVAFTGFLAILILPLRMGEFARPWLLKRESGVSMSAGFGTIAIERVVDGVLVSLWLTLALFAVDASEHEWVWWLRLGPLSLFAVSLVVLVAFVAKPDPMRALMRTISGWFGKRLQGFVMHVLDGFHEGLQALPSRSHFLGFFLYSVVYWGINAVAFWVLALGCGLPLGLIGAVAAMGILAVGIMLPAGVGLFGNFQAALLVAFSFYAPEQTINVQGAVFIFVNYLCQLVITFGAGIWGMATAHVSPWSMFKKPAGGGEK